VFALTRDDVLSQQSDGLYFLLVGFLLSWWIARDRARTSVAPSFDFHFYVVFFWLLVVPYYLLRTRGKSGLMPALLLLLLAFSPTLLAVRFFVIAA
jgi:hypothetical protein